MSDITIPGSMNAQARVLTTDGTTPLGSSTNPFYVTQTGAPSTLTFGNIATPSSAGTTYLDPTFTTRTSTANEAKIVMPFAGTMQKMYVGARTGTTGDTLTLTVRKNGVDTTMVVALAAAATSGSDLAHSFSFAEGDTISIKAVAAASTSGGAVDLVVSLKLVSA